MTRDQMLAMIELLERMRDLRHLWIEEPAGEPLTDMSLFLMRRHLTGQVTTPTSLAQASGLAYTTATRRVTEMQQKGLLDYRPRTRTGRSFSVHPSPLLIAKMTSLLTSTQAAIAASTLGKPGSKRVAREPQGAEVIGTPSIAAPKLGFGAGLDILVLDDPAYYIARSLRREQTYLMGGRVRFHESSIDGLRDEILANAEREVSKYDVIAVDLPMIAEFAQLGVLTSLDDVATESVVNSADFIAAAWRGTRVEGRHYAIPILINPQLLFYRKDLLAGLPATPPVTTDEVLAIARALHDPAKGRYGVSWTAAAGVPVGQAFIQFLADFGQPVVDLDRSIEGYRTDHAARRSFKPLIDTERGHATAEFMLQLLDVSPPDTLRMGWEGQVELLRQGSVAMAYEWASRATQLSGVPTLGQLGFLPHPTGRLNGEDKARANMAPIGGFAFGIPSNVAPKRRATAWNAIEWLSSPEVVKLLAQHGGYVTPRRSVAQDPDVQRLSPMIATVERMASRGQINLWSRAPVAGYSAMVAILGQEIHAMLSGDQSVSQALARAQARAEAM